MMTEITSRGTSMVRGANHRTTGTITYGHTPQERYLVMTKTLATWLFQQQTLRWLIRNEKQTSIIMQFQTKESLGVLEWNFHRRLIAARRGKWEQPDTTTTNKEPPD